MKLYTKCSRCGAFMEQYHDGTFPGFTCCMFNSDEYSPSYAAIDDLFYGWDTAGENHALCPACVKDLLAWFIRFEDTEQNDNIQLL